MRGAQVQPLTPTALNHLGPVDGEGGRVGGWVGGWVGRVGGWVGGWVGRVGGWVGGWGGWVGGWVGWDSRDPLVALIILNTRRWGSCGVRSQPRLPGLGAPLTPVPTAFTRVFPKTVKFGGCSQPPLMWRGGGGGVALKPVSASHKHHRPMKSERNLRFSPFRSPSCKRSSPCSRFLQLCRTMVEPRGCRGV